ncbi:MAG TPA: hypothetical protein VEQ60_32360, partial [Longimicrobium sp.]|nr:hypothetical protein [Longimicrobium sp.]
MHIHLALFGKVLGETGGGMRMRRIAAVTAGLILAGAVFGTITGIAVMIAWGIVVGDLFAITLQDAQFIL